MMLVLEVLLYFFKLYTHIILRYSIFYYFEFFFKYKKYIDIIAKLLLTKENLTINSIITN